MAISNVPWFATTVEGPFGVGAGGIFATIVRVVQAFVCVWVIISVNIKFILNKQVVNRATRIIIIVISLRSWRYCAVVEWDLAAEPLQYSRVRFDGGAVTSGEDARNRYFNRLVPTPFLPVFMKKKKKKKKKKKNLY